MPYRDLAVGALLAALARDYPDHPALIAYPLRGRPARWTFLELENRVETCARNLVAAGLGRGDRAAVWATNRPEWVVLQFALARAGVVMVTMNTALREAEAGYLLRQSEVHALFLISGHRDLDYLAIFRALGPLPGLRHVFFLDPGPAPEGLRPFAELEEARPPVEFAPQSPDDVVNMQYTSGTTGFPKGVMLSHRNIVNNAAAVAGVLRYTPSDRVSVPVPLFHCFGCVIGVLGCYTHASTMVLVESFDPLRVLEAIQAERCTSVYGVPTMFLAELEHPEFARFDLTSLRTGVMAGAVCPVRLMERVMTEMHIPEITIAYGLTEASPAITQTSSSHPLEKRLTTVGKALPEVEVKIVDPATLREVPRGRQGELLSRGYLVMKGYYNDPESTARAITADGWLRTGDLAVMDADGYIIITGRLKEMIIRGGENVAPKEIEELLRTHPAISDAAVYGVPDEFFGEEVAVAVRLKTGQQVSAGELQEFVRARLARFKTPRYVEFVDAFPQTPSGKIQKFRLREAWVERSKSVTTKT